MTKEELKEYQHNYWLKIKNDPSLHEKVLKRRKGYRVRDILARIENEKVKDAV